MELAWYLGTPGGNDLTVLVICLILWAGLAALPGHFLGLTAGILGGAGHTVAVLVAIHTSAQDAGHGAEGEHGRVPHLPMGVCLPTVCASFLMFLLQDNLDSSAAHPYCLEVARDEAQRGAEAGRGWRTGASPLSII